MNEVLNEFVLLKKLLFKTSLFYTSYLLPVTYGSYNFPVFHVSPIIHNNS